MENILIEILVGLPGSGKTHYAKENGANTDWLGCTVRKVSYVDFDRDYNASKSLTCILNDNEFPYWVINRAYQYKHWILDGLFLTNAVQRNLLDAIYNQFNNSRYSKYLDEFKFVIQFVYFKEDREACLHNDTARNRQKLADITIKNADYEKPNIEELQKAYPEFEIKMVELDVHKMNTYETKFKVHESWKQEDIMRSETWTLGGTWGNCWGDSGTVSADEQPTCFKEFDDLVLELCPDIKFVQYKQLYNETTCIKVETEHDYYGGSTEEAWYECDLKKLYNMMVEMNLIKE